MEMVNELYQKLIVDPYEALVETHKAVSRGRTPAEPLMTTNKH